MKLIFPDVHNREHIVQPVIDHYSCKIDEIIFLGDILDNPHETIKDTIATLEWFNGVLQSPNVIWLIGNHENPYIFPNTDGMVNGRTCLERGELFRDILKDHIHKAKLFHWDGYWLYSHAGIHPSLFTDIPSLQSECDNAIKLAHEFIQTRLFMAGYGRGGPARYGGINWLDWDWEFAPISNLNQIVGHTADKYPRFIGGFNSRNWCLDTKSNYYALTDGENIVVRSSETHEPFFPPEDEERQLIYEYLK